MKHQEVISKFATIAKEITNLHKKVRIIAFLELVFACDKDDRSLSFDRLAQTCQVGPNDVEMLLMKAMSLDLVRGTIDQVEQVVHIDWVMPRYLNTGHLQTLVARMHGWEDKMEGIIRLVENGGEELLQQ